MILLEDIAEIKSSQQGRGYDIVFNDGRTIWLTKARTVIALLILIAYGEGSERDLAQGSARIPEIKRVLAGKYPAGLIKDYYGDANKPFSELWNEEGFVWIKQPSGQKVGRSQRYLLRQEDHEKLFLAVQKAFRQAPSITLLPAIKQRMAGRCNLCGSSVVADRDIMPHAFSRDRLRRRIDHRVPVAKGGSSADGANFQLLCFYCNKSKWQICNICHAATCDACVLAFPERSSRIVPTGEDIQDRMLLEGD